MTWCSDEVYNFFPYEASIIKRLNCKVAKWLHYVGRNIEWEFSVKSAYFLLEKQSLESDGGSPASVRMQSIWNWLWSIQVPNKVKVFSSWACRIFHPLKPGLFDKHIQFYMWSQSQGSRKKFTCAMVMPLRKAWQRNTVDLLGPQLQYGTWGDLVDWVFAEARGCNSQTISHYDMVSMDRAKWTAQW